ncbi:DNA mismatch repair protein MutT [Bifidobacterium sp. DSM 109958]|uniref:8-oxo-dGTP diphosphatase n=1 Tax=Bifidobacterium moraviense TaxID=2675323 RepID=A0A7Y0F067_9BIFI|nr:(deoxy)nucleoside triphosphate pyrophosphohydrolase [Bifidobacterium sp. DSM 109958]NMM99597.1 DNA mismatch repair protein MutT [Bifidobacterium sp. DSM 109958]
METDRNETGAHPGRRIIDVVGAAIVRNGTVLCARRGPGKSLEGFWEFPGGKIEPHETPRQALHREIEEELLCEVDVAEEVCTSAYDYDFGTVRLTTFVCHLLRGMPRLTEHADIRWLSPSEMPRLDWAPVDRQAVGIIAGRTFAANVPARPGDDEA